MLKKINEKHIKVLVICFFMCAFYIPVASKFINYRIGDMLFLFVAILAVIISISVTKERQLFKEWLLVILIAFIYWVIAIVSPYTDKTYTKHIVVMLLSLTTCVAIMLLNVKWKQLHIFNCVKTNFGLLIELIFLNLLVFRNINNMPMWDGHTYCSFSYADLSNLTNASLVDKISLFDFTFHDITSFFLCGHLSVGAVFTFFTGIFIFGKSVLGIRLVIFLLLNMSIVCVYKLLKIWYPLKNNIVILLCTLLYMVNPAVIGLSSSTDMDYISIMVLPIILYFLYSKKIVLSIFFGTIFVCSKEPDIVYYFALIIGFVILQVIKNIRKEHKFRFIRLFNVDNLGMAVPGFAWLGYFISNSANLWGSGSSGNSGFVISSININIKLLQILFVNFNWLLWIIGIVCVIFTIVKKNKSEYSSIPMFLLLILSICFQFAFVTVCHYRYLSIFESVLALIVIYYLLKINVNDIFKFVIIASTCLILFVQSFYTIDPLMKHFFVTRNVGNGEICSLNYPKPQYRIDNNDDAFRFDDSIVYNWQYNSWTKLITSFFEEVQWNEETYLVIPSEVNTYSIFGRYRIILDGETYKYLLRDQENSIEVNCLNVDEYLDNMQDYKEKRIVYIEPYWLRDERMQKNVSKKTLKSKEYNSGVFKATVYFIE